MDTIIKDIFISIPGLNFRIFLFVFFFDIVKSLKIGALKYLEHLLVFSI